MKKIYLTPEMEIIEVKAQQTLLAGSVPMYGTNAEGEALLSLINLLRHRRTLFFCVVS